MALALALGEIVTEARMKEIEDDLLTGESVRAGGVRAHAATYGTAEEIEARYGAYAQTVDQLVSRGSSKMAAYRQAGGQVELELYEGETEGFFSKNPNSEGTRQAIARIIEFVHKQLG